MMVDVYRIRVGSHRVIYSLEDLRLVVIVLKLDHRRDLPVMHFPLNQGVRIATQTNTARKEVTPRESATMKAV